MYNFDTSKWNRDYYLWHRVLSSGVDCGAITIISDMKRNHYQKTLRKYIKQSQKAKNR